MIKYNIYIVYMATYAPVIIGARSLVTNRLWMPATVYTGVLPVIVPKSTLSLTLHREVYV